MDKTRVYLISEYPFYSAMLNQCTFSWYSKIKTAAVGFNKQGNIELVVNKDFFYSLPDNERVGLLMHEMLHLLMEHLTRGEDLDRHIANVAMDIAINQYIPKELLPSKCLLPEQYSLPPNKSYEFYYVELMKNKQKNEQASKDNTLDNHDNWNNGQGIPDDTSKESMDSQPNQGQNIAEESCSLSNEIKDNIVGNIIAKASVEAESTQPGSTPIHVKSILEERLKENSKVNWKQKLKTYIGRSFGSSNENTHTKACRRMGFAASGKRRIRVPKIMIAEDQSGSVSTEMINKFNTELQSIFKSISSKTEVVFFDTDIAHSVMLSKYKPQTERHCNGGTNFQTVIDYANKKHPDLLIMFTDGECDAPTGNKYPILWVLTNKENSYNNKLKGAKIYL